MEKIMDFLASMGLENIGKPEMDIGQIGWSVLMGIGTVFVGLVAIVIICKIVGLCCGGAKKEKAPKAAPAPVAAVAPIQNRGEIIAAVCAAAAEELGTDVSAIRVRSFKKL